MSDDHHDDGGRLGVLPSSWSESDRFLPRTFVQPTLRFFRLEAASGILMLIAAVVAVILANSPLSDQYFSFFDTRIEIEVTPPDGADDGGEVEAALGAVPTGESTLAATESPASESGDDGEHAEEGGHHGPTIDLGPLTLEHLPGLSVRDWINDALMALFFFVVGLEIKRELVVGELRDPKAAALPAVAALGGMVVPAALYAVFNAGTDASGGWGIPMATDIAFAVGVLSMVGSRVPVSAKLFLLALAIVDDLGAIIVIALFYTDQLFFDWLGLGAVGLLVIYAMQKAHVRSMAAYIIVGSFIWVAILESGVHATIAGVAVALMTPVRAFLDPTKFVERAEALVSGAAKYMPDKGDVHELDHHALERIEANMGDLRRLSRESLPPLTRMEFALQPWSSYVIVPLFALANAGVVISSDMFSGIFSDKVILGIFLGLVVGKLVGVTVFSWVAVKVGLGRLPRGTTWGHMIGLGLLAGIGFTVALFVAALSFEPGSASADSAKIGIFAASIVAGLGGFAYLKATPERAPERLPKETAKAEASA